MIRQMDLLSRGDGASCWGVGFVAMDVVDAEGDRFAAVGGSCGNVMAILAWLGWTVRPIARLGDDRPGDFIRGELRRLGVDVASLTKEKNMRSPIVLQRFETARDGTRTHRFSLTCPGCGRWLPRHRSVTLAQSIPLASGGDAPNVFYFDRVSPASLRLGGRGEEARRACCIRTVIRGRRVEVSKSCRCMPRVKVLTGTTGTPARFALLDVPGADCRDLWGGGSPLSMGRPLVPARCIPGGTHRRRRRLRGLVHSNADPSDGPRRCRPVRWFDELGDQGSASRRSSCRGRQLRLSWGTRGDARANAGRPERAAVDPGPGHAKEGLFEVCRWPKAVRVSAALLRPVRHAGAGSVLDCQDRMTYDKSA